MGWAEPCRTWAGLRGPGDKGSQQAGDLDRWRGDRDRLLAARWMLVLVLVLVLMLMDGWTVQSSPSFMRVSSQHMPSLPLPAQRYLVPIPRWSWPPWYLPVAAMRPAGVSPQLQRGAGVGRRVWALRRPRLGPVMICHPPAAQHGGSSIPARVSLTCQACTASCSHYPAMEGGRDTQTHGQIDWTLDDRSHEL